MRKKDLNRTDDDDDEEGRTKIDEPKREGSVTRENNGRQGGRVEPTAGRAASGRRNYP